MSARTFPVQFFLLTTISGIAALTPVCSARLVSSYCMLSWPLPLDASLPYCSILDKGFRFRVLRGTNLSTPSKIMSLNLFHISSTQLLLFAHVVSLSQRNVCSPITSVLWYAGTDHFCCGSTPLPIPSTSNKIPQWSLIPVQYCKL